MESVEKESHGFTPVEQDVIFRDTVFPPVKHLPLRLVFLRVDGSVRVCSVCDPFFEKIDRDCQWEGRTHSGAELYRRWCGWRIAELTRERIWTGLGKSVQRKRTSLSRNRDNEVEVH